MGEMEEMGRKPVRGMEMGESAEAPTNGDERRDEKRREKRIDLSLAQVAASAAAAVTAAVLASFLGVYGTVIGAALVSVVATTGGAVYQHLFRRTGEQLREATVLTRPQSRNRVRQSAGAGARDGHAPHNSHPPYASYNESTLYGSSRRRVVRRRLLAAAAVFAVAMALITGIETVTGPVSGWFHGGAAQGTSIGHVLGGQSRHSDPARSPSRPAVTPSAGSGGHAPDQVPGTGSSQPSSPGASRASGPDTPAPAPSPTPSTRPSGATSGTGQGAGAAASPRPGAPLDTPPTGL